MAKILVADDNSNIQKMVGLALKDQGIDVVAVGNGEAAVRKISDIKPDLVLADVFMPVRNGYEVCKYVKDDETLKHIPVILLVGAFDPLDEQEAQRVGADGVLKKPFVPPDPLISMVKSALTRAGISIGPPLPVEKAPEAPRKTASEWLKPAAAAKLAALTEAKSAEEEETADVPEEFPTMPQQLKIAAGQGPVAFGGMLDTAEEDDPSLQVTAHSPLEDDRNWGGHGEEEEEEHEEEESSPHAQWRPGGLDEAMEKVAKPSLVPSVAPGSDTPDWRDAAFHGNSPAKNVPTAPWQNGGAKAPATEAASVEGVAVSTLEAKPAETPVPFSGDAWAAAMAAGVEEKLKREVEGKAAKEEVVEALAVEAVAPEAEKEAAPASNWFSTSATPWETEARKASQLAATWDAPPAEAPVAEVAAAHEEAVAEEAAPTIEAEPEPVVSAPHYAVEETHELETVEKVETPKWANAWEAGPSTKATNVAPVHEAGPNETQEIPVYRAEVPEWYAAAPAPVEEAHAEVAPVHLEAPVAAVEEKQPNMDELVARVLAKMNPEMLQKVTHDILKPVIEALVKDELNNHKS